MHTIKTGIAMALLGMTCATAVSVASPTPTVIRHVWQFSTEANPAVADTGAVLTVHPGELASGWLAETPGLQGGNGGVWDLGGAGNMTCDLATVLGGVGNVQQITVRVTQWWDGGIYPDFVSATLPDSQSVSSTPDVSGLGAVGGWVVDETIFTPAQATQMRTLTLAATSRGAVVDSVVVEASVVALPPLVLDIRPDVAHPGSVQISWDQAQGNATIESSSNLSDPAGWAPLSATAQLSNGRYVITTSAGEGARFFRLKK